MTYRNTQTFAVGKPLYGVLPQPKTKQRHPGDMSDSEQEDEYDPEAASPLQRTLPANAFWTAPDTTLNPQRKPKGARGPALTLRQRYVQDMLKGRHARSPAGLSHPLLRQVRVCVRRTSRLPHTVIVEE